MVKSVVKPLKMGILRERIVPKKSVFTRAFGVFCFEIPWGRCLAPKPGALPTALHPDIPQYRMNVRIEVSNLFVSSYENIELSSRWFSGVGGTASSAGPLLHPLLGPDNTIAITAAKTVMAP